jgi:hypothetical protein
MLLLVGSAQNPGQADQIWNPEPSPPFSQGNVGVRGRQIGPSREQPKGCAVGVLENDAVVSGSRPVVKEKK